MAGMCIEEKLKKFMEDEMRSCSMDFGCATPLYIYRMWGGTVEFDKIAIGLKKVKEEF